MKKTLILGWGKSGKSACGLLRRFGREVVCFDDAEGDPVDGDVENRRGMSLENALEDVETVVVNPAVPVAHPVIRGAKAKGIEVISEIELGYRCCNGNLVAVTGTNGKTTTVTLIKDIFTSAGIEAYALGNIGVPFSSAADKLAGAVAVLEISSFQLETTVTFAPRFAVCLNVTPDHIERHKTFEEYTRLKAKLFENQSEKDFALLNADDPVVSSFAVHIRSEIFWFSVNKKVKGAYVENGEIFFDDGKTRESICAVNEVPLKGNHNLSDVLAAVLVAKLYGIKSDKIALAVKSFRPPRYRIELIKTLKDLKIYNDSKSTNIDSTVRACEAMDGETTLIVGGWDKKISYESFFARLPEKVVHIVCCGDNSDEIIKWAPDDASYSVVKTATLERAVEISLAYKDSKNLLFSPSTSSFDRYTDYVQRGRHFDVIIKALANG